MVVITQAPSGEFTPFFVHVAIHVRSVHVQFYFIFLSMSEDFLGENRTLAEGAQSSNCLQTLLSYVRTIVCQHIKEFLSFAAMLRKKKTHNNTSLHISASPCKWNTYIRHHCGLHKCLKVINISSSVRLMCLVIGYLCCGLPLSKTPHCTLVFVCVRVCAHVCERENSCRRVCVHAFMHRLFVHAWIRAPVCVFVWSFRHGESRWRRSQVFPLCSC